MKRSEINAALRFALAAFEEARFALPRKPRFDVTDFGLGRFREQGLVLVNLAEEAEYCEKVMFARKDQRTPAHCHLSKKEDIIVRRGVLAVRVWPKAPPAPEEAITVRISGEDRRITTGREIVLDQGERITIPAGLFHEFWPLSETAVLGEVSTRNDDEHDNVFADPAIGRFPEVEEDEPAILRLVSDRGVAES
jgi:hypothetical protein